ncbi:MAG: hypothetical protein HOV80_08340 [Polyangiaceae bacterium]|nr:hypothetical protein [Polyangiaceae bacterium]
MRNVLASSCLAFLLLACEEEAHFCHLMDCEDALTVEASSALGAKYTVEVVIQGTTSTISCDIPADADGKAGVVSGSTLRADCFPSNVVIYGAPAEVTVRFRDEDGTLLGEEALAPEYEVSQPNGEGCEPICSQAQDEVQTVPAANPNPKS